MLSILIPVYNYNIVPLVKELYRQGKAGGYTFEIRCYDDASTPAFKQVNEGLNEAESIFYMEMPENLGRSRIRNKLAADAQYPYLLFMDCDSRVVSDDYLKGYMDRLQANTLLYGGRCYQVEAPKEPDYLLHWTYGSQREVQKANQRQLQAYHSFMTNNFLVPKTVFDSIKFDESLLQYGHEDTLFGLELKKKGVPILHFDNPLEHEGLEKGVVFLDKTIKALENLSTLSEDNKEIETRLLVYYNKIQSLGLQHVITYTYPFFHNLIYKNLISSRPSLFLFDLFKLGQLTNIKKQAAYSSK